MPITSAMAVVVAVSALSCAFAPAAHGQTSAGPARPMITQPVVETNSVQLFGNTRPEANAANDRGRVPDTLSMEHLLLQLRRPPAQEQALTQLIDQLHNPASGKFHQWLTPSEFGAQFGPAASDIAQITGWLQRHGFRVNTIYPSGMTIDFSGTAGQVRTAFHTEIHHLQVNGVGHIANMSDPQIPAALAPAVVGIVSLHDFMPRPTLVRKLTTEYTIANCSTSAPTTCYAVTPPDLATIYNFNPLFQAGTSGQNQTIYLIEDTDLYTTSDWTTFRSTFGLSAYTSGSLSTIHPAPPSGSNNCADPGVNSDDIEAILDAEYASAAAPSARIVLATCADTNTTFGALFAIQNLINGANPPAIISLSYIECEAANGASSNAAFSAIYQQGVAEGTSIFVAAGDEDAGSCDYNGTAVTHGIGVNAYASTPYNVAVGGTDFSDTYSATNSTYWSPSNTSTYGSAKSYVPEIPWNDSCAGQLLATFEQYTTTYGSSGFCNSRKGASFLNNGGGSGGPSGCATGSPSPSTPEVVSGSCAGYAKPSWQSGVVGIPNDGVRDIPDVSLFAADGLWGHYYIFCFSDPGNGGAPCTGAPSGWGIAGGTSFASPIMAGIQALVNQYAGGPQGNPNYQYYQLAANEYGASGSSTCNSSNGNTVGSACIFYDVTLGDIDANCSRGSPNCYRPSGNNGVLSTSNNSYAPAYRATTGWDFATGIGTVNAYNLVTNWSSTGPPPPPPPPPPLAIPPFVIISSPANGATYRRYFNVNIAVSAADTKGIASITIAADGTILKTCTNTTSCSDTWRYRSPPGTHTITATAIDSAGIRGSTSIVITDLGI
jgi:subtilase family serine protease